MEDGLGAKLSQIYGISKNRVLILVLVEDGLGVRFSDEVKIYNES